MPAPPQGPTIAEQIAALVHPSGAIDGVDLLIIETISNLKEAEAAVAAARWLPGDVLRSALSRALSSEGITVVVVPTTQLGVYLLVAAAVGVLAAIGPARRASNVDMIRAVVQQ